jgi:hypothetical protein
MLIWALWVATQHFCKSVDSRIRFVRDEILGGFFNFWIVHDEANVAEEAVVICQSNIAECHDLWIIRFLGIIVSFLVLRILITVVVWLWLASTFAQALVDQCLPNAFRRLIVGTCGRADIQSTGPK